jgi:hypothetical protein
MFQWHGDAMTTGQQCMLVGLTSPGGINIDGLMIVEG